jgi:hypothetical protein
MKDLDKAIEAMIGLQEDGVMIQDMIEAVISMVDVYKDISDATDELNLVEEKLNECIELVNKADKEC